MSRVPCAVQEVFVVETTTVNLAYNSWAGALGQVPLGVSCGPSRAPHGPGPPQVSWWALLLRVLPVGGGPLIPSGWPQLFAGRVPKERVGLRKSSGGSEGTHSCF